jgi:hypothetical protein
MYIQNSLVEDIDKQKQAAIVGKMVAAVKEITKI